MPQQKPVRISDLAKELGVKSNTVLEGLHFVGISEQMAPSSSLTHEQADRLRRFITGGNESDPSSEKMPLTQLRRPSATMSPNTKVTQPRNWVNNPNISSAKERTSVPGPSDEAADKVGCVCKNSRTGGYKRMYATQSLADVACEESKKTYADGDTLCVYQCPEAKCWHVGNSDWVDESREDKEQSSRIREIQGTDLREQETMSATEAANAEKSKAGSWKRDVAVVAVAVGSLAADGIRVGARILARKLLGLQDFLNRK